MSTRTPLQTVDGSQLQAYHCAMTYLSKTAAATGIALVLLLTAACSDIRNKEGSGRAESVSFDFDGFDSIDVSGGFELRASVGGDFAVDVTVDDNLTDDLKVELEGSTLSIGFESGRRSPKTQPVAVVTMPSLSDLDLSGASSGVVNGVDAETFRLDLSGASDLSISGTAVELLVDASGSSAVNLLGVFERVELDASSASRADFEGADIDEIDIDVSGASSLDLGQAQSVTGDLGGASVLSVASNTNVSVDISGESTVDRRD